MSGANPAPDVEALAPIFWWRVIDDRTEFYDGEVEPDAWNGWLPLYRYEPIASLREKVEEMERIEDENDQIVSDLLVKADRLEGFARNFVRDIAADDPTPVEAALRRQGAEIERLRADAYRMREALVAAEARLVRLGDVSTPQLLKVRAALSPIPADQNTTADKDAA